VAMMYILVSDVRFTNVGDDAKFSILCSRCIGLYRILYNAPFSVFCAGIFRITALIVIIIPTLLLLL
jgi:hypothetical protein